MYVFLLLQSLSVQKAAYGCSWYNRSQSLKKLLNFFIMRSKKPVRMTAGKFYYLSLETFADVIIIYETIFFIFSYELREPFTSPYIDVTSAEPTVGLHTHTPCCEGWQAIIPGFPPLA
jgi:hypothetical protein